MQYSFIQPYKQSESIINLFRQLIITFFDCSPVEIRDYIVGLYTLEGLSSYYKILEEKKYVIKRPYIYIILQDIPRITDEIFNPTFQTVRRSSLLIRMDPKQIQLDSNIFPTLLTTNETKISRIEQYMNVTILVTIVCESYEMTYDMMRYCQMILTDKSVTFRNLIYMHMLSVDDVSKKYPSYVLKTLEEKCIYSYSLVSDKRVFAIPSFTWVHAKATDYTINNENVPFDGATPTYSLSVSLNITYSEPVSYVLVY